MPGDGPVVVDRLAPDDWPDWRALRLQALRDYPLGFLRTYADAVQQPDDDWRAWLARPGGFWLAREQLAGGSRPVGMCGAWEQDGRHWLGAVFVVPERRGQGLLERLVDAAAGWAREQGGTALLLEVHEDNPRAQRAYARLGFVPTGRRAPYPLAPGGEELEMALALSG